MIELLERLDQGCETRIGQARELLDAGAIGIEQLANGRLHVLGADAGELRQALLGKQRVVHRVAHLIGGAFYGLRPQPAHAAVMPAEARM